MRQYPFVWFDAATVHVVAFGPAVDGFPKFTHKWYFITKVVEIIATHQNGTIFSILCAPNFLSAYFVGRFVFWAYGFGGVFYVLRDHGVFQQSVKRFVGLGLGGETVVAAFGDANFFGVYGA